jgi:hypothetical protein
LFVKTTKEREVQLWLASMLQLRGRDFYTVIRENVVDLDKEVDISVAVDGVGQVPIEVKPPSSYGTPDLEKVVPDQLVGRYMTQRERDRGILLLVRLGVKRGWHIGKKLNRPYCDLVQHLRTLADRHAQRENKFVVVESIDTTLRSKVTKARAKKRKKSVRRGR